MWMPEWWRRRSQRGVMVRLLEAALKGQPIWLMSFQHGDEFNHTIYLPALPHDPGVRYSQATVLYEARTSQYVPWQVRRPKEIDLYEAVELVKSTWSKRVIPPRLWPGSMVALAWYGFCIAQIIGSIIFMLKAFL